MVITIVIKDSHMNKILLNSTKNIPSLQGYNLAIGFFDGFHLGHRKLITKAKSHGKCALLSFSSTMKADLKNLPKNLLLTEEEKYKMASRLGVDLYLELVFDTQTKNLTPIEFLSFLNKMKPESITVGEDFTFGKMASGKSEMLKVLEKENIKINILPLCFSESRKISTTWIKKLLSNGDIEEANKLLGYNFFYKGIVVHGKENGRKIAFPTANLIPDKDKILIKEGVYKTKTHIGTKEYKSMTNIGNHPTIEALKKDIIETNIFDFNENIYGKEIEIEFISFIRPQLTFPSFKDLEKQLETDKKEASK